MKITLLSLACVALCFACSAPKMAYKFDYHNYEAGRKAKDVQQEVASNPGPLPVNPTELVAMEPVKDEPAVITAPKKTYEEMTKKERRELRKEFKKDIKEIKQIVKKKDVVQSVEATQAIDRDLKLAAIFGAVGLVGLIIGGQVFWIIGGIAMLIGVVFFIKWLIRQ